MRLSLLLVVVLAFPAAAQNRGVPQNGFPTWAERTVAMRVNRTRAAPTVDPKACADTTVRAPLMWHYTVNRSARFHSTNMQKSGQFMHNSPCVVASNISTTFLPATTCDGAVACACSTGAMTCTAAQNAMTGGCTAGTFSTMTDRMNLFGAPSANSWAENIAAGYTSPSAVHTGWMNSSGHCTNILGDFTWLGVGHMATGNYWTQNFRRSTTAITGTLITGSHEPQLSGGTVDFRVNYYNTAGGPQQARLNVDGTCTAMTLERGTQTNGTWLLSQTLSGTTCRRYVFTFTDPSGNVVNLPETGSYGVGGSVATCADWSATAPTACPTGGNQPPTIMTAASATPSTVTATTTAVSVLGADDAGEAALTYTWSSTGPASVTFSPNASNAAKASSATFTRAGSYVLTVTVSDAGGAMVTSTVNVTVNATPSVVTVSPASASVATMATQTFTAAVRDQFNQSIAAPTVTWMVSGGGTIASTGVFTAGATGGGPFTVTATSGSASGTAQVSVVANAAPTIATAAAANPSPVTASTTALTVLGADDGGEGALVYTWSATGPATVSFSPNGTNAAKSSTATFTRAGSYSITVTVRDAPGLTVTSTVAVTVQQTPTGITVTPATATLAPSGTQTFVAAVVDQFAQPLTASPTWMVSGGGTISSGVFTAGTTPGGPFTITATHGSLMATAQVSVSTGTAPTVGTSAAAAPSTVAGTTTALSVVGADDGGEGALVYTWSATGPAAVMYSANMSNGAKSTTATFTRAGTYVFTVTIRDAQGLTVTSTVTVTVAATPTTLAVSPTSATVIPSGAQTFTALVSDQFAQPLASQPSITWSVAGGGSIAPSGVFTAGTMAGGPHAVTATAGALTGTASITVSAGVAPTIATAAAATPNPVTALTTQLSVLGADDQGEASLQYSWDVTGPGVVSFSANDSNAAKTSTATFGQAGTYAFTVTVRDVGGLTATSQVSVVVNSTLTALSVSPSNVTVMPGQMATFLATAVDQFGDAMTPTIGWTTSGGGTISNGVFTAGATAGGPFTITATSGTRTATAQVTISSTPPPALTVALTQPTSGGQVSGMVSFAATTSDDARAASVAFLVDGAVISTDTSAPWTATWDSTSAPVGAHVVKALVTDGLGDTAESAEVTIEVVRAVMPDTTAPVVSLVSPSGEVTGAVRIEATAMDDVGVTEVRFQLDGAEVAVLTVSPWTFEAGTLAQGAHTVRATARDAAGNVASVDGTFSVIDSSSPPLDEAVVGGCGCSSVDSLWLVLGLLSLRGRRRTT